MIPGFLKSRLVFTLAAGFILLLIFNCRPADPNYEVKPLRNTEYTGFISRDFFQVVVDVPVTRDDITIYEEREQCKKEALLKRDKLVLPILKGIARNNTINKDRRKKEEEEEKETEPPNLKMKKITETDYSNEPDRQSKVANRKSTSLIKGEFSWFLDSLILFKEDYSKPDKCVFVYRTIQEGLFARVENVNMNAIGDTPPPPVKTTDTTNQQGGQGTTTGTTQQNQNFPQTIPTAR